MLELLIPIFFFKFYLFVYLFHCVIYRVDLHLTVDF